MKPARCQHPFRRFLCWRGIKSGPFANKAGLLFSRKQQLHQKLDGFKEPLQSSFDLFQNHCLWSFSYDYGLLRQYQKNCFPIKYFFYAERKLLIGNLCLSCGQNCSHLNYLFLEHFSCIRASQSAFQNKINKSMTKKIVIAIIIKINKNTLKNPAHINIPQNNQIRSNKL